jgi:hypothetical protein
MEISISDRRSSKGNELDMETCLASLGKSKDTTVVGASEPVGQ